MHARTILLFMVWAILTGELVSQPQPAATPDPSQNPETLVREIYKAVSFDSTGPGPDWEKVRSMFIPEAVVILRTNRDSLTVFSVQGFINDFVTFIEQSPAKQKGFTERIVRMKPLVFGNMAHFLVLYEAHIPGTPRPPQQGVDSFELMKRGSRWYIAAITNEIPTKDRPLPTELK
jgi:hypothetical protein